MPCVMPSHGIQTPGVKPGADDGLIRVGSLIATPGLGLTVGKPCLLCLHAPGFLELSKTSCSAGLEVQNHHQSNKTCETNSQAHFRFLSDVKHLDNEEAWWPVCRFTASQPAVEPESEPGHPAAVPTLSPHCKLSSTEHLKRSPWKRKEARNWFSWTNWLNHRGQQSGRRCKRKN